MTTLTPEEAQKWLQEMKYYEMVKNQSLTRINPFEKEYIYDYAKTGRVISAPKISDKEQKLISHIPEVIKHLRDYCITLQSVADTTLSRGEKKAAEDRKIDVSKLADGLECLK